MTHNTLRSTAALGAAALAWFCLPAMSARAAAPDTPSLAEPAPTPGWVEGGPSANGAGPAAAPVAQPRMHGAARHAGVRHEAMRPAHASTRRADPVANAAMGVAGGVADLGSMAAYPVYCFPHYGSCPLRVPYRP